VRQLPRGRDEGLRGHRPRPAVQAQPQRGSPGTGLRILPWPPQPARGGPGRQAEDDPQAVHHGLHAVPPGRGTHALAVQPPPEGRGGLRLLPHRHVQEERPRPTGEEQRSTDLLQLPRERPRGDAQDLAPSRPRRQDDLLLLPQRPRLHRQGPPQGSDGQRDLLHVPPGQARTLRLGACAGAGELFELPHPPRLQQPDAAGDQGLLRLPAVPHLRRAH